MGKSTSPITYHYDVDGHDVAVTRRHTGTAYAANGNVGNPTEYFVWSVAVDGVLLMDSIAQRAIAYEYGRAHAQGVRYLYSDRPGRGVGIRNYNLVAEEMRANYRGREVAR